VSGGEIVVTGGLAVVDGEPVVVGRLVVGRLVVGDADVVDTGGTTVTDEADVAEDGAGDALPPHEVKATIPPTTRATRKSLHMMRYGREVMLIAPERVSAENTIRSRGLRADRGCAADRRPQIGAPKGERRQEQGDMRGRTT
jgi:hypothetical protein